MIFNNISTSLRRLVILPVLFLVLSCGGSLTDISRPGDSEEFDHYLNTTVAFVNFNKQGAMYGPTCTGFFVSPRVLGTALHCVKSKKYELIEIIPGITTRKPIASKPTIGKEVYFISVEDEKEWLSGALEEGQSPNFHTAKVVAIDPENDTAVLELVSEESSWADWLEIRDLVKEPIEVGEKTFSISNPFGETFILSEGRVSRVKMNSTKIRIQHQTHLGHGSSGSALLDVHGRAIGITSTGSEWGLVINSIPISYLKTQLSILKINRKIAKLDKAFEDKKKSAE